MSQILLTPVKPQQADAGSVGAEPCTAALVEWEVGGGLLCRASSPWHQAQSRFLLLEDFISLLETNLGMVVLCVQRLSSHTPTAVPKLVREGLLFN